MPSVTQVYQETILHMKDRKTVITVHFILQAGMAALTILFLYFFESKEWKYAFICLPAIIGYQFLWSVSRKFLLTHNREKIYNLIFFIITVSLFLAGYFSIFYDILNPNYKKGSKCSVLDTFGPIQPTNSNDSENYTIMSVKYYDEDNNLRYGCACASDKYHKDVLFNEPLPHKYFEYGDEIGQNESKYKLSQVKLASWKCVEKVSDAKANSDCSYRYYANKSKANTLMNSYSEGAGAQFLKDYCVDSKNFVEVLFESEPGYYSYVLFVLLITIPFCALFALSFNEILIFISTFIVKIYFRSRNKISQIQPFHHSHHKKKSAMKKSMKLNQSASKSKLKPKKKSKPKKNLNQQKQGTPQLLPRSPQPSIYSQQYTTKESPLNIPMLQQQQQLISSPPLSSSQKSPHLTKSLKSHKQSKKEQAILAIENSPTLNKEREDHIIQVHQEKFQQQMEKIMSFSPRNQQPKMDVTDADIEAHAIYSKNEVAVSQMTPEMKPLTLEGSNLPKDSKKRAMNMILPPINRERKENPKRKSQGNLQYNPDEIPAQLAMAKEHRQAWIVGEEQEGLNDENPGLLCKCCSRQRLRNLMPQNCRLKELSFLGSGYPQYFYFIKFSLFLLIVIFLFSGIYGIATNIKGSDCLSTKDFNKYSESQRELLCHRNYISIPSLGNKKRDLQSMNGQQGINLVTIVLVIVALQFFRRQQRIVEVECDANDINPSDKPGKKLKVSQINLCYDTQEQFKIEKKKQMLMQQKQNELAHFFQDGFQWKKGIEEFQRIDAEIQELEIKLERLEEFYSEGKAKDIQDLFAGWAFISFRTEQGFIAACLLLIICLGAIVGLKIMQSEFTTDSKNPSEKDIRIAQVFAVVVSLGILILNGFLPSL